MSDVEKRDNEKFCSECGELINSKAVVCPKCGCQVENCPIININGRNRFIAALLAFFLGSIGAHKFYLGQIGWGIAYFLFCWTFIPTIVSMVEFIMLLVMNDTEFNRRFGGN
jgi:hypothetical protein